MLLPSEWPSCPHEYLFSSICGSGDPGDSVSDAGLYVRGSGVDAELKGDKEGEEWEVKMW